MLWVLPTKGKALFAIQGEYSVNMIKKALLGEDVDVGADSGRAGQTAAVLRGMSAPGGILRSGQAEKGRDGRYRMLYAGGAGASFRNGYNAVHGRVYHDGTRHGNGERKRIRQECCGGHWRFHFLPFRHHRSDQHEIQRCDRHGRHFG